MAEASRLTGSSRQLLTSLTDLSASLSRPPKERERERGKPTRTEAKARRPLIIVRNNGRGEARGEMVDRAVRQGRLDRKNEEEAR